MIIGKNIDLREIEISDAEFVLSLRLDPELNQHLSPVENNIKKQREWIRDCKNDKQQWYYIVQNKNQESVGTIRIYDIKGDSFCWGSWIIIPKARNYATLESIMLLYEYAFYDLGFNQTHFDVRKANTKAINFYLRFGAVIIEENDIDLFMLLKKETFLARKKEHEDAVNKIIPSFKLAP